MQNLRARIGAVLARTGALLVAKLSAWLVLGALIVLITLAFGLLAGAGEDRPTEAAPPDSESERAEAVLDQFPGADEQSVLIVASRNDGGELRPADLDALAALGGRLTDSSPAASAGEDPVPSAEDPAESAAAGDSATQERDDATQQRDDAASTEPGPDSDSASGAGAPNEPVISDDGEAALLMVPITVGETNSATAETVNALRTTIAEDPGAADLEDSGVSLLVTGGPAIGADIASAFDGADFTLLIVTIVIVALLLILTYRSPILWLLPLIVIGTADGLASTVTAAIGDALDLQFDAGIISVLVFGAGANYALLLISRYREELAVEPDHRVALASAWRHTATTILASNLTVVLSLLSLVLAVIPGTRGLGLTAAVGLVLAAGAVLFALPPVLAICGPRVFWPFVPLAQAAGEGSADASTRPTSRSDAADGPASRAGDRSIWRAIATRVVRRPGLHLGVGIVLLGIMATGLAGTSIGLDQAEKFRVQSESAEGLDVLSEHFPAGESQPIWVVADAAEADDVVGAVSGLEGVVRAGVIDEATVERAAGDPPTLTAATPSDTGRTASAGSVTGTRVAKIMVTGEFAPDSPAGLRLVESIRDAVHAVDGANAEVGGAAATELDARDGNARDFAALAPLVLAISGLVLLLILRAPFVALTLLLVNVASTAAAIGLGASLSRLVFGQAALDAQVPILAFLFLTALGIDYSIFLAHRAKKESEVHGATQGIVAALTHTGGVITSAGIVLAGVFAALGMLPLMVLGQLGLIVGVGVLVDTVLVRTVIVPAIISLAGARIWWPVRAIAEAGTVSDESRHLRDRSGPGLADDPAEAAAGVRG